MIIISKWLCALFVCVILMMGCGRKSTQDDIEGTLAMVQRLEEIAGHADNRLNAYYNDVRADYLHQLLLEAEAKGTPSRESKDYIILKFEYGRQLLHSGQSEAAIEVIEEVLNAIDEHIIVLQEAEESAIHLTLAVSYLRLGEQENCITLHNPDSCLFPITKAGIHKQQRGSRGALAVLNDYLLLHPNDLEAIWLLNIASMTVGEYPEKLYSRWTLPPELFVSDYEIKRFHDRAPDLGLDVNALAGGSVMEDFDGDNFLDLIVSSMGVKDQVRYFRNNGDGTFDEKTIEAGLEGLVGGLNMVHADYNNDGYTDVFILRGGWFSEFGELGNIPNSLLRNNGDGTFSDLTEKAGLLSFHPTQTAVWWDYNNDGWLDLFIGNETINENEKNPCELYRNNRDGTFTECAKSVGIEVSKFVKGVTSGDYNNDGRPDLFLSVFGASNMLFRNDGPISESSDDPHAWKFTEHGKRAGLSEPKYSFPTWFWDFNNDGWEDLFVCGYRTDGEGYINNGVGGIVADYLDQPHSAETMRLYRNRGDGTFAEVSESMNLDKVVLGMGCNYGDLDNDGWLDFYVGTGNPSFAMLVPNRMFRNEKGMIFQDVTTSGGFGHLQKGHGVSFGDIDHDGDQDIYSVIGGAFTGDNYMNVLFENPGNENKRLTLKLVGESSNRSALGSRIKVLLTAEDGSKREIHRTVSAGGSFGASPFRQEIGLGKVRSIDAVEIFWPHSGKKQIYHDLDINTCYQIEENNKQPRKLSLESFDFQNTEVGHHHEGDEN